jgi:hypothetical protein
VLQTRLSRSTLVALAAFALATPAFATRLLSPQWDVWVVDADGKPVVGISVTETHQDFTYESKDHMETLFTDVTGHVQFSAKYLRAGAMKSTMIATEKVVTFQHRGRRASIAVGDSGTALVGFNLDKNGNVIDWTGSPDRMKSHIVAHPQHPAK